MANKKNFLFSKLNIFGLLTIVSLAGYFLFYGSTALTNKPLLSELPSESQPSLIFHPDQVLYIEWLAGKEKFSFSRVKPGVSWTHEGSSKIAELPDNVLDGLLQDRLNVLAQGPKRIVTEIPTKHQGSIKLTLASGSRLEGQWDHRGFWWNSDQNKNYGYLKSLGFRLELFQTGVFLVTQIKTPICPTRIERVNLRNYKDNKTASFNTRLVSTGDQLNKEKLNQMELWMGQNCSKNYWAPLDGRWVIEPRPEVQIDFVLTDGSQRKVFLYPSHLVSIEQTAWLSKNRIWINDSHLHSQLELLANFLISNPGQ